MEHVIVIVGLTEEEPEDGGSCSAFGGVDVFEDGTRGVAVRLEVEEELGPEGLVVRPPGGEDPGMGSGFDEVLGNLKGCGG